MKDNNYLVGSTVLIDKKVKIKLTDGAMKFYHSNLKVIALHGKVTKVNKDQALVVISSLNGYQQWIHVKYLKVVKVGN